MDSPKHSIVNYAIPTLFLTGILYLCFWSSSFPYSQNTHYVGARDELEEALTRASMANKTVIIAVVNKAYADQDIISDTTMLDLFLDSFWLGEDTQPLINHLLLVAVDQTAYDRCRFLGLNCYRLKTDGVDFAGEKLYMSEDFVKMMWRRTQFLLEVLKRGYSFIFTIDLSPFFNFWPQLMSLEMGFDFDEFNMRGSGSLDHDPFEDPAYTFTKLQAKGSVP